MDFYEMENRLSLCGVYRFFDRSRNMDELPVDKKTGIGKRGRMVPAGDRTARAVLSAGDGSLFVIVKTCSDSLFSIGQKNCQLFVAKLRNFLDSHNRMVLY